MILSEDLTRLQERVPVQELIIAFLATYPYKEQIKPIYPNIELELVGKSGFYPHIIGLCSDIMREKGLKNETFHTFVEEASSGDYQTLLKTCAKWFSIPSIRPIVDFFYDKLGVLNSEFNKVWDGQQQNCNKS